MLKETLCQIGFTNNEAKIYIALVELGPQPANILSRKAGLKRTTVYPILNVLLKKSLISSFIKNGVKYFAVNDLNNLLEYVERKKRLINHHRDFVIDILPKMEQLKSSLQSDTKVHYFEGIDGVETVMNDSLKANGKILCISCWDKWLDSDMNNFIKSYINSRLFDKKVPMRALIKDTEKTRCFLKDYYERIGGYEALTDIRFVKGGDELFDNIVNIYDNTVAMVSPERGFEFGVLINSKEFASTQRSVFELAWKGALVHNNNYENKGN